MTNATDLKVTGGSPASLLHLDADVRFVNAEMALAGVAPHLEGMRPLAARSLAAARAEVIALSGTPAPPAAGSRPAATPGTPRSRSAR